VNGSCRGGIIPGNQCKGKPDSCIPNVVSGADHSHTGNFEFHHRSFSPVCELRPPNITHTGTTRIVRSVHLCLLASTVKSEMLMLTLSINIWNLVGMLTRTLGSRTMTAFKDKDLTRKDKDLKSSP